MARNFLVQAVSDEIAKYASKVSLVIRNIYLSEPSLCCCAVEDKTAQQPYC